MKSDSALSEKSIDKLKRLSHRLNLDEKTRQAATGLYHEFYEKRKGELTREKNELSIRIAILVASKGQEVETVTGEKVRGIGLSPTQVLKEAKLELGDFFLLLKDFLNTVTILQEVKLEIKKLIDRFSFSLKCFEKYENTLGKLRFRIEGLTEERARNYKKLFKEFGWLVFIIAKKEILNNCSEIHEHIFLMTSLFHFLIVHSPKVMKSGFFMELLGGCKLKFGEGEAENSIRVHFQPNFFL